MVAKRGPFTHGVRKLRRNWNSAFEVITGRKQGGVIYFQNPNRIMVSGLNYSYRMLAPQISLEQAVSNTKDFIFYEGKRKHQLHRLKGIF